VRRSELVRLLERIPPFPSPRADLEQVVTPADAAATLLATAERLDGLAGRSVIDLGCGTGRLAIGAALLGAEPVHAVDVDRSALAVARASARALGARVAFRSGDVSEAPERADIVLMNPPFGAQTRHADRPFWDAAYARATRGIYAFALGVSRSFIARGAVARSAQVVAVEPVPWTLPRTFAHHTRQRVSLDVDLWAIRTEHDR
jgi:putative methylase